MAESDKIKLTIKDFKFGIKELPTDTEDLVSGSIGEIYLEGASEELGKKLLDFLTLKERKGIDIKPASGADEHEGV